MATLSEDRSYRAQLIGDICMSWSAIESIVALITWQLLSMDEGTGRIVTGGLDMLPRISMAIALARHLKAGREIITPLEALRKTIQDGLDQRRNQAVHGINQVRDGKWLVEMHRGTKRGPPQELPVSDLRATLAELHTAQNTLGESMLAWAPGWLRARAAHMAAKTRTVAEDTASSPGS